jgi:hypothetical protein
VVSYCSRCEYQFHSIYILTKIFLYNHVVSLLLSMFGPVIRSKIVQKTITKFGQTFFYFILISWNLLRNPGILFS